MEASGNYSYIVDALAKGSHEILMAYLLKLKTRATAEAKILKAIK